MALITNPPVTKEILLAALEDSREQFLELIEPLTDEQLVQPGAEGDWSVKDILAHLARWEGELIRLLWQARQGHTPNRLVDPAKVDELNARWQRESRARPLAQVLDDFHGVRLQTLRRVDEFATKDLTDPQRYGWLAGTPLWQWIAGDSYEHEAEHAGQMRAWLASQPSKPPQSKE